MEDRKAKVDKIMKKLDLLIREGAKIDCKSGKEEYHWEMGKSILDLIPYPEKIIYITMTKVRGIEVRVNNEDPDIIRLWREITI